MSKPTIADSGWAEFTVDHLRAALKAAEGTASDMAALKQCDGAECGRIFDGSDPRASTAQDGRSTYDFCPACVIESRAEAMMSALRTALTVIEVPAPEWRDAALKEGFAALDAWNPDWVRTSGNSP